MEEKRSSENSSSKSSVQGTSKDFKEIHKDYAPPYPPYYLPPPVYEEDEIDLYELWLVLCKRAKIVLGTTIFFGVVAFILAFFIMRPVYKTEVTLMPLGGKGGGELGSLAGLAGMLGVSLPISSQSGITVEAVLKSRILRERIVKRLNLLPVLFPNKWDNKTKSWKLEGDEKPPTVLDGAEKLKDLINVSTDRKTGVVTLSVEFKENPELAYKIAQVAIEEAQKILNEKSFTMARKYRIYIEKRLKDAYKILKTTEELYKDFIAGKIKEVPLVLDDKFFLEYGKLKGELIAKEGRLKVLKEEKNGKFLKEAEKLKQEIKKLKDRLYQLEQSSGYKNYVALPDYQLNLKKLEARFSIAMGLYQTLVKQYELAKAQEMKEQISFQVIDPPYVPEKPYKPKKKLIMAVALVSGLFLGIFLAFFVEWIENVKKRRRKEEQGEEK